MDSRLFHYVVAVEECGTISSAARTLFLSQPALTKQIGKLESELGFQIFDRSKNPLGITEQGEIFLDFAGRYLELEKEFQQKLDAVSGEKHQDLIVMTTSRGGMYAGVRTSAFLDAHPEIHVEYHNTDARSCEEMLESEEREIAVYTDPVQSDWIEYLPLEEDPLLLVIPKDSPALDGVEIGENSYQNPLEIDVKCLRRPNNRFVLSTSTHSLFFAEQEMFRRCRIHMGNALHVDHVDTRYAIACGGGGIVMVPLQTVKSLYTNNQVVYATIKGESFYRYVVIAKKRGRKLSTGAKLFWKFMVGQRFAL